MDSRRRFATVAAAIVSLVLGLGVAAPVAAPTAKRSAERPRHPDRILVKLRHGATVAHLGARAMARTRAHRRKSMPAASLQVMELRSKGDSLDEAIAELNASPLVAYAEPDYYVFPEALPNDPKLPTLWGLDQESDADVDAPEAWDVTVGDPGVVVAVVDTGVDYEHEDLAANMWTHPWEVPNGIDDDGNGYVDDIHGIDCFENDSDPMDVDGHGTHVAGTIGAVGNNGVGVTGVAQSTQIMALRFLGPSGGAISDAIECLNYALELKTTHGVNVRVTNNSWGGGGYSQALVDAIEALNAADVLFVTAAGNSGSDNDIEPHYPSNYEVDNVVAVAASGRRDALAYFSNFGVASVDLAAPGVDVLSTTPGDRTGTLSGTSMSAAYVSGAAALILSVEPSASVDRVKSLLIEHVDPVSGLQGRVLSNGRLNVAQPLCEPGDMTLGLEPNQGFRAGLYIDTPIRVWLRDCGEPLTGAYVSVAPSTGEPEVVLLDDGEAPDVVADDGIYTALWQPSRLGALRLDVIAQVDGAMLARSIDGSVVETTRYAISSDVPFDWIDARAGQVLRIQGDDARVTLPLGFKFFFHGALHRRARISSNGYLTFSRDGDAFANAPLPTAEAPAFLIAPFWDDLHTYLQGRVYALREGSAPDRRLTIQWDRLGFFDTTGVVTFQVTLYELDGRMVFRYLDATATDPRHSGGAAATVGIQDGSGEFSSQFSFAEDVLEDGSAIEFRVDDSVVAPTLALVAGSRLQLRDVAGRLDRRSLALGLKDAGIAAPPIAGSSDPSRWGGTLRLRNPLTQQETAIDLPAQGWKSGRGSYRFRGTGACRSVSVRNGSVRASCRGAGLGFGLTAPSQGAIAVRLDLGSKTSYCALFGGHVIQDYGAGYGSSRDTGSFAAAKAPAPDSCALP